MSHYTELPDGTVLVPMPGKQGLTKLNAITSDGTCAGCIGDNMGISVCFSLPPCHVDNRTDNRHVIFVEATDEQ